MLLVVWLQRLRLGGENDGAVEALATSTA
eukprot:COSAG01_NODE_48663_length_379_cov_0.735714_2_plen_28_part_01